MNLLLDKFAQTCKSKKKLSVTKQESKPDSKKSKLIAELALIEEKKSSLKEESE